MDNLLICQKYLLLITLLVGAAITPSQSFARGENITNGYICEPKNPGGEETRLYFRQQDGVAINLSQSATFPVVCPVMIPFQLPPFEAGVVLKNGVNTTRCFSCALE